MSNQQQFYGMQNGLQFPPPPMGMQNFNTAPIKGPPPPMGMGPGSQHASTGQLKNLASNGPPTMTQRFASSGHLANMATNMNGRPAIQLVQPPPVLPVATTTTNNFPQNGPPTSQFLPNRLIGSATNSATSSRTSSPGLLPGNLPPTQLPPVSETAALTLPPQSSQPVIPVNPSLNHLNANWNPGVNTSFVATPPRSSSGLATPINSSTPNLVPTSASMNQITAHMQGLNVNKPPTSQFPPVSNGPPFHQVASTPNLHYVMPTQTPHNSLASSTQQLDGGMVNYNNNNNQNLRMPSQPPQINGNHPPLMGQQQQPPTSRPIRPMYASAQPSYQAQQFQPPSQMPFNTQPMMQQQQQQQMQQQQQQYLDNNQGYNVVKQGFSRIWGNNTVDLLQNRNVLPMEKVKPPPVRLNNPFQESINCSPDIFRCTLTKIPETNSLLQKTRLPLGVLIHPFRDLNNLPVISCSTIVRCRSCRTYINPFVYFVDSKKWKCNLCYRVNELPDEFQYDPVSKTCGDPTRRPEIKSSTIEFIAPSEYMLRPPQPAVYLFLLDVSSLAQQTGYLNSVCSTLSEQLDSLPGDARTQVGFIAYNSAIHFYNIAEGFNQPHEITVLDIEDVFLPYPDNLLINLKACKELIKDLLVQLPKRFETAHDTNSALGAALQVAFKLMSPTGGRVTVFQTCLPNFGPGALQSREDPNNRSAKDVQHLGPATDFYKRLALEFSAQQIAVDLFLLNSQYCDLATISGISKFSGGCMHHFPLFNTTKVQQVKVLQKCFERYLTRKIGFEAVMRVRCTRGLAIHTFHGNFFVRSTDLLSLPNVNPDSGFGMQITYEESLSDIKSVCFQAALLYTSSKAERRIRVHTLCIPVCSSLSEILYAADSQCIVGLLSKMAVDRSLGSSLTDARDAFINATVDILCAFKIAQNLPSNPSGIVAPDNLALMPLYILALLKHAAFRTGTSTRLDDRVFGMCEMKTLPLDQLIRYIYPDFYLLDSLFMNNNNGDCSDDDHRIEPPRIQLSAEKFDSRSMLLLDTGPVIYIYVGSNVPSPILNGIFDVNSIGELPDLNFELPTKDSPFNEALHAFIDSINEDKPYNAYIQIIKDTSQYRSLFIERFVDDRNENSLSYYEFLQHLRTQVK